MADIPDRLGSATGVNTDTIQGPDRGQRHSETADGDPFLGTGSIDSAGGGGGEGRGPHGTADGDGTTESEPLPIDLAFEILKNGRRRRVLHELSAASGDLTTGELSDRIAAWENDKPVAEISSEERKRVYVGLYQCHLPKMDDADVVVFNKDRGLVAQGEHADLLDRYLEPATREAPADTSRRSQLYRWIGTTALVAALLALSLAVETVSGVPTATLGLAVLLAVTGTICLRETRTETA